MDKDTQEFLKNFGANISRLRTEKGLSKRGLGRLIEVSRTTICKIENGTAFVTAPTLLKLSKVLNTEPHELIRVKKN